MNDRATDSNRVVTARRPSSRRPLWRRLLAWIGCGVVGLILLLSAWLGYGISNADALAVLAFADAVERWQTNPDFRAVTEEYVLLGSVAMQRRAWGLRGDHAVMAFRSLPGLPPHLAMSEGSDVHYRQFARGPLSSYLHLSTEQGVADFAGPLEELSRRQPMADEDVRDFLRLFDTKEPVATDAGAVASVGRLIRDIDAARPLKVRAQLPAPLRPHIEQIARSMGVPTEPARMTPQQQRRVLQALDEHVRQADPELWRTKQLNDLLCGVWGQTYGRTYVSVVAPAMRVRRVARVGLPILLALLLCGGWLVVRRRVGDRGVLGYITPSPPAAGASRVAGRSTENDLFPESNLMERTLIILKPDAVQRGLIGEIITRFEKKGIQLAGAKFMKIPTSLAEQHYAPHKGKPFYEGLVRFMTSSPVLVLALQGKDVIAISRKMMGATFGSKAEPGTIRGDFGVSNSFNLIHGSDSPESAKTELSLWFRPEELVDWTPASQGWVYDMSKGQAE